MKVDLSNTIVIVSGLPRSGTSMMMQMLNAGGIPSLTDGMRSPDDDNPKGYYELEAVKKTKQNSSWLADAAGCSVKVVHLLLRDLPLNRKYRIVFMKRHMEEVLASQAAMLERRNETGSNLTPDRLAKAYQQQLDKLDQWISDQDCMEVLYVAYHDVMADPNAQAARINKFFGGHLDVDSMAAVTDAMLYRQRRSPSS